MPVGPVDYGALYEKRYETLRLAYARFNIKDEEFVNFIESGEFEDYMRTFKIIRKFVSLFTERTYAVLVRQRRYVAQNTRAAGQ